jgi:hypothetical protein
VRSFIICTHPKISLGRSSQGEFVRFQVLTAASMMFTRQYNPEDSSEQGEFGGRDMWHSWDRRGKCTRF